MDSLLFAAVRNNDVEEARRVLDAFHLASCTFMFGGTLTYSFHICRSAEMLEVLLKVERSSAFRLDVHRTLRSWRTSVPQSMYAMMRKYKVNLAHMENKRTVVTYARSVADVRCWMDWGIPPTEEWFHDPAGMRAYVRRRRAMEKTLAYQCAVALRKAECPLGSLPPALADWVCNS